MNSPKNQSALQVRPLTNRVSVENQAHACFESLPVVQGLEPGEVVGVPLDEIRQLVDERAPRRRIRLAPLRAVLEGLAGGSHGLKQ